jgi:hypothetical protein
VDAAAVNHAAVQAAGKVGAAVSVGDHRDAAPCAPASGTRSA